MVKQIRGCCLRTQIELELEHRRQDSNEIAQFDKKNVQFIEFYHLKADGSRKKKFDRCLLRSTGSLQSLARLRVGTECILVGQLTVT